MDRRVLVADSELSLATVYECYLESHGFDVVIATDGIECLELLRQARPDVLVLDADLLWGGADGVLAYLRSDDDLHSTSVILVADAPPNERAAIVVPPVVAVLQKPFRLRVLLTLLRSPEQDRSRSRQALADSLSRSLSERAAIRETALR